MDNFNLIDLDKVLDEFEKTEEDPGTDSFRATWPRGADRRSSPPASRPLPVSPPRLDGAAPATPNIRPSSLKVHPSAHLQRAAAGGSELHLPDDQTSVSSGYDSLRTSSEFIVAPQEPVLNLASSAVPEEITPTVERQDVADEMAARVDVPAEMRDAAHHQLPAVALDNYALRPDLVHESAAPPVDLVPPAAFPAVDQQPEVDEAELDAYLGLEAREEPEGTEETLPDVAASCTSGADPEEAAAAAAQSAEAEDARSKASSTPDLVEMERAPPDLLHDSADSPAGLDQPASLPPSAEKRLSEPARAAAEGAGADVPKKKARPNTLLGLTRPAPPSDAGEPPPVDLAEEEAPRPRRPNWLALPSRSLSTESAGGSSSTLTPGPAARASPMSEDTVTPGAAAASPCHDRMELPPEPQPLPQPEPEPQPEPQPEPEPETMVEEEEEEEEESRPEPTPFSPELGRVAPVWVHDRDAPTCMGCSARFTLTRRRHHCRACGKVFCSLCCSHKAKMHFLDGKEARVCAVCFQHLIRLESSALRANEPPLGAVGGEDLANPTSALRGSRRRSAGGRTVVFADGIRPGGDLSESDASARVTTPSRPSAPAGFDAIATRPAEPSEEFCFLSGLSPSGEEFLPVVTALCPELQLDVDPDIVAVAQRLMLSEAGGEPVRFAVTRHLHVLTQRVRLSCCVGLDCWTVSTRGLAAYGQPEVVMALQCLADEMLPPLDLFRALHDLYTAAKKGEVHGELSCFITGPPFLGSKENAGFLFIRPTYQCLEQLALPTAAPFLIAVLIQRWEAPLAKLFPLRLLLRLGHQYRYYPCPIFSTRDRGPVYDGSGMTLLQLLVDFRNFSYTVPAIPGLRLHLSPGGLTRVLLPRAAYSALMRTISNMDSHVLALGAAFSPEADSHLVCVPSEVEENALCTQAISIQEHSRQVTGASFVVLTGGVRQCKSSIVEDSVMVHMSAQQLQECLAAMKAMRDFVLVCQPGDDDPAKDEVHFEWTDSLPAPAHSLSAPRPLSWVDGAPLDEPQVSLHRAPVGLREVARCGEQRLLWALLRLLHQHTSDAADPPDPLQLGQEVAGAVGRALQPHLPALFAHSEETRAIALRVRLSADSMLDYDLACRCHDATAWVRALACADLDAHLVPLLIDRALSDGALVIELELHVVE